MRKDFHGIASLMESTATLSSTAVCLLLRPRPHPPVLVSPPSSIEGDLLLLLTRREGRAAGAPLEQRGVAGVPLRLSVWSLMMTEGREGFVGWAGAWWWMYVSRDESISSGTI